MLLASELCRSLFFCYIQALLQVSFARNQNGCDHPCQAEKICHVRKFSNTCYYLFTDHRRTWDDSKHFCNLQNLSMVTPPKNMTGSKLTWLMLTEALKPFKSVWLGGKAKVFPEWSFINGVPLRQTAIHSTFNYNTSGAFHGVVLSDNGKLKLSMRRSHNAEHFICRFDHTQEKPSFYLSEDKEATNWFNARSICVNRGGDLLYANKDEDFTQNFKERLQQRPKDTVFYVGLTYRIWKWQDGRPFTYYNWRHLEPTNKDDKEQCLMMFKNGDWNDNNCVNQLHSLCQDAGNGTTNWSGTLSTMGYTTVTLGVLLVVAAVVITISFTRIIRLRRELQKEHLSHTYDYIDVRSFSRSGLNGHENRAVESDFIDSSDSKPPPVPMKNQMAQPVNNIGAADTACLGDDIVPRIVASTSEEPNILEKPVAEKSKMAQSVNSTDAADAADAVGTVSENTTAETDKKCEPKKTDCPSKESSPDCRVSICDESDVQEEQTNSENQCEERELGNEYLSLDDKNLPDDQKDGCDYVPEDAYASLHQKRKATKNVLKRWPWSS